MIFIAAALGDHINHATCGAAVLCIEPTALNLNFADELEGDGAFTSERRVTHVRDFHAIDDESVFRPARTIDGIAANAARGLLPLVPVIPAPELPARLS